MDPSQELDRAANAARNAEAQVAPWIEKLARFGLVAKGVVYILIGYLAARAAFGSGGSVEGGAGAMASLRDEPFGVVLLWLIAIGLLGYVVWRLVCAIRNPEDEDAGHRAFYVISALVYAGLALEAMRAATGSGGADGHWTATLLEQPFGRVLAAIVGLAIAGYGIQQIWRAWTADLDDQLDLSGVAAGARTWIRRLGRFGLAARGIVLVMLGYIFLRTALNAQPTSQGDVEGVLESMRDKPWLLGLVALGFIAYGVYNVVRARYRRIRAA